jgi:hypothetical protein
MAVHGNLLPAKYRGSRIERRSSMKPSRPTFLLAAVCGAASLALSVPEPIDRLKLEPLHKAGQAFREALANPGSPLAGLKELRQQLEMEAEKVEGRLGSKREKYLYDLYSTAAAEYGACLARYEIHRSRERLDSEVKAVADYLRRADLVYRGEPEQTVESAQTPAEAPPPAGLPAGPSAASPVPAPPAPSREAAPPAAASPAEPPPAPPAAIPAPAPPPRAERPIPPPAPRRLAASPEMTPTQFRKAADRVKIAKKADAVRGCDLIAQIAIPGPDRQGAYEIGGRNFFYEDSLGLARLKTVEAGGDTFRPVNKSRTGLTGEAYRCGG